MEQVIRNLAQKEGMCVQDVVKEMELAIAIGRSSSDPAAKVLWQSIPCKGEYPTPEELIVYLAQCALAMEAEKRQ